MRGQGLPFSTIVLAVISLLILVLIVFFITGGLGRIFPAIGRQGVTELQEARTICTQWLSDIRSYLQLSNLPTVSAIDNAFKSSAYCTSRVLVGNATYNCFQNPVNITADFIVYTSDGIAVRCRISGGSCGCSQI